MTPQQWSDMENNRSRRKDGLPTVPTLKTLRAVARGLGVPEKEVIHAAAEAGQPSAAGAARELPVPASDDQADAPFSDDEGDGPGIAFYYEGLPPLERVIARDVIRSMWERQQQQQTTDGKKAE